MAINPLYAKAASRESGIDREKFDSVKFENVGDKVVGTVLFVGDPFDKPNKFYDASKDDESKKFINTQKVILELEDGKKVALYLSKTGHYVAIFNALEAANVTLASEERPLLSDIPLGWKLGMKWSGLGKATNGGSRPHLFEARLSE